MEKAIKYLGACVFLLILFFLGFRYGWKAFDFKYCYDVDGILLENVEFKDGALSISGGVSNRA